MVAGIVEGCRLSGCALLGGETAEMPGFYQLGEYDLAGFCVGIAEKSKLLDGSQVQRKDVVIGLASRGIHSNGFSLVRKIVEAKALDWDFSPDLFEGKSLGDILLTPTQIYVKPVLEAIQAGIDIRGMAHITGGGLPENLPRCLNKGQSVQIYPNSWEILPIFRWLAQAGEVKAQSMFDTFNMGIGFVVIVPPHQAEATLQWFQSREIPADRIGEVIEGSGEILGLG